MAGDSPLVGALDRITRPPMLTVLAVILLVTMGATLGPHLLGLSADRPGGTAWMGDYLAFWTGASLIHAGDPALYDLEVQAELQRQFPGDVGWLPYVNPPLLGWVLAPTVPLGFVGSFYVFCLLSLALFVAAAWALRPHLPHLTATPVAAFTTFGVTWTFQPVFETMFRGQNSILTLALLAFAYAAHRRERPVLLGVALGLLSFKPQFGLLLGLVLLVRREGVPLAVASAVSLAHYALGAWLAGWDWPRQLLAAIATIEPGQPMHTDICIRGAATFALPEAVAPVVSTVLVVPIVVLVCVAALRVQPRDPHFPVLWAAVVVGAVLTSPHVQYYDAAVLVLPVLWVLDYLRGRDGTIALPVRLGVAGATFLYHAWPAWQTLGVQPLAVGVLVLFGWVAATLWPVISGGGRGT